MRAAREAGITVMLDGQGGDELLGGYRAHLGFRLADLLAGGQLGELRSEFASFRPRHGPAALVTATARPFAPESLTRLVRGRARGVVGARPPRPRGARRAERHAVGSPFPDRLRRYQQLVLTRRGLPELLRYEDRNSMAHSIEARVPFLDHRLVELAFSLPGHELIRGGRTKDVLRRALADLLPQSVRERTDKLGFVTPERLWFRGALGELAADVFASRSFAERGFVDQPSALRRLERHRRGELDAGMELWRALNLELWARTLPRRVSTPDAYSAYFESPAHWGRTYETVTPGERLRIDALVELLPPTRPARRAVVSTRGCVRRTLGTSRADVRGTSTLPFADRSFACVLAADVFERTLGSSRARRATCSSARRTRRTSSWRRRAATGARRASMRRGTSARFASRTSSAGSPASGSRAAADRRDRATPFAHAPAAGPDARQRLAAVARGRLPDLRLPDRAAPPEQARPRPQRRDPAGDRPRRRRAAGPARGVVRPQVRALR